MIRRRFFFIVICLFLQIRCSDEIFIKMKYLETKINNESEKKCIDRVNSCKMNLAEIIDFNWDTFIVINYDEVPLLKRNKYVSKMNIKGRPIDITYDRYRQIAAFFWKNQLVYQEELSQIDASHLNFRFKNEIVKIVFTINENEIFIIKKSDPIFYIRSEKSYMTGEVSNVYLNVSKSIHPPREGPFGFPFSADRYDPDAFYYENSKPTSSSSSKK